MPSRFWCRKVLVLGLLAFLAPALGAAAPAARADSWSRAFRHDKAAGRSASFWEWLTPIWAAIGCKLDPDGACLPAEGDLDIGCSIDPSGACRQSHDRLDIGCSLDPHGSCGNDRLDIGCKADPNGACAPTGE